MSGQLLKLNILRHDISNFIHCQVFQITVGVLISLAGLTYHISDSDFPGVVFRIRATGFFLNSLAMSFMVGFQFTRLSLHIKGGV